MDRIDERVAIALGSNLGDRRSHIEFAIDRLGRLLDNLVVSPCLDTEPLGVAPQPRFLNAAAVGSTALAPRELLDALLAIEGSRGRGPHRPGVPRTIDLDLILHGDRVMNEAGVVVPHPRFRQRRFVLQPLAEIAPDLIDPVTGLTVSELLDRLERGAVEP